MKKLHRTWIFIVLTSLLVFPISSKADWEDITISVAIKKKDNNISAFLRRTFKKPIKIEVEIKNDTDSPIIGPLRLVVKNNLLDVINEDEVDGFPIFHIDKTKINAGDKVKIDIEFERDGNTFPFFTAHLEKDYESNCRASQCFESGVFFSTADEASKVSVNFDNATDAWSTFDEACDYAQNLFLNFDCIDGIDLILQGNYILDKGLTVLKTHMLYGYKEYDFSDLSDGFVSTSPYFTPLGTKIPLILVHGWQGDNGKK